MKHEGDTDWTRCAGGDADSSFGNEGKHSQSQTQSSTCSISSDNDIDSAADLQLHQQPVACQENEEMPEPVPVQLVTNEVNNFQIVIFWDNYFSDSFMMFI